MVPQDRSGMNTPRPAFTTDIPARLDSLPWSGFHILVIAALGITWILDGLEVTVVGSLSAVLAEPQGLSLTNTEIGAAGSLYLVGAVLGALFFGDLTDRFGRKKLFMVTVGVYLAASIATGLSWNFASFAFFRALTGAGIGGEYAAINSAIQEFTPARLRGRIDLLVNGSFWIGAALGAGGSLLVLDPRILPPEIGWRAGFVIGGALALTVVFLRRFVPESPRWLMTHGRMEEAEAVTREIERRVLGGAAPPARESRPLRLSAYRGVRTGDVIRALVRIYPRRTVLGVTLMATQAFCYNAIFFTYALVLTNFYGVASERVGWFILPFAAGNFLGPLLLGPLFDTLGRKRMIGTTYAVSGALMLATGILFVRGALGAASQTALWTLNFFFASAGASAAYLTVGECFPLEVRARTIALFYAFGTAVGGVGGPILFGALIETGSRPDVFWGYVLGGGLMLLAAGVEAAIGVRAECLPLEDVARPLSAAGD
jgi:MFS family permease